MTDDEPYAFEGKFLRVEIECLVPGPQLGSDERAALDKLYKHIEAVGELLFATHDPDGYEEYLDRRDEGPTRSWNDLITDPVPIKAATVTPIRPDVAIGPSGDPVAFGKGLAYLRRSQGMSRMQLKVMAGLGNYPMLAEIEAGKRPPSDDTIDKLAKAFELSPAELVARCLRLDGGDS